MTSGHNPSKASTPLDAINMASPLPLREWNDAFKHSTPVRPSPRHTPSKTNWRLGTPQRTPQTRTPAPGSVRPSSFSTRRVQQVGSQSGNLLSRSGAHATAPLSAEAAMQSLTGRCGSVSTHDGTYAMVLNARLSSPILYSAAAASTPAQAGQRFLPRSQTSDLVAPSLASLPNALSADYWLKKAHAQEAAGDLQAAMNVFELANTRDVRPATVISRAYGEFLMRHKLQRPAGVEPASALKLQPSAVKARPTAASDCLADTQDMDGDQENSQKHNVPAMMPVNWATPRTAKGKSDQQRQRRQSRVHFQTPEANVASEAADPDQDDRNNSSKAGSTPFSKAKAPRRVSFAAQPSFAVDDAGAAVYTSRASSDQESSAFARRSMLDAAHADAVGAPAQPLVESTNQTSVSDMHADAQSSTDKCDPATTMPLPVAAPGSTPFVKQSKLSAALRSALQMQSQADANASNGPTDLNLMMSQLMQAGHAVDNLETSYEATLQEDLSSRPGTFLGNRLSPVSGAIHLTPVTMPPPPELGGITADVDTPATSATDTPVSNAHMTPLCLDLDNMRLSASETPSWSPLGSSSAEAAMAGHLASADDFAINPGSATAAAFSSAHGMMTDNTSSPEILGWHEQHGKEGSSLVSITPEACQPSEQMPSLQTSLLPASAFKAPQSSTAGPVGRAVRIQTPATAPNRSRLGKHELKGLGPSSPVRSKQDMGSIALLSPVRANSRTTQQLGAAKVITPVRRSARKTVNTPLLASMLREAEFAYAPNEALARPRHLELQSPSHESEDAATAQQDGDTSSTPTSITGVSLAGDCSISAFPGLDDEPSFVTSSSSSSRQSPLLMPEAPYFSLTMPGSATLLVTGTSSAAGAVAYGTELCTTNEASSFATPPPAAAPTAPAPGPVTRSKSTRKARPFELPTAHQQKSHSPSLSPTEANIREGLRRSARLTKHPRHAM